MEKTKIPYIVILGLIIVILFLLRGNSIKNSELDMANNNYKALNDDFTTSINKYNQEVAKRKSLEFTNSKQLLEIETKDSLINLIKDEVKRLGNKVNDLNASVTALSVSTSFNGSSNEVVIVRDTIHDRDLYYSDINNLGGWIEGFHMLGKDTSYIDIEVKNDFLVSLYYERDKGIKNILKPKYPVVELTNKNPYTNTKDLRVVNINDRRKTGTSIGLGVGYGITDNFQLKPFIGISLHKTIIEL